MGEVFIGQATIEFKAVSKESPIWFNASVAAIGALSLNGTDLSQWSASHPDAGNLFERHRISLPSELIETGDRCNVVTFRYLAQYSKQATSGL